MRSCCMLLWLSVCSIALSAQTNITFRSKVTFPNQNLSNIWGYVKDGREYALVGGQFGLIIVEVTNPDNPVQIVAIPGPNSAWKEIKTYSHYAYVVSEGGFGVQIIDLNALPSTNLSDYTYSSYFGDGAIAGLLTKAHALHIDETKGYLYVYGSNFSNNSNGGKALWFNLNINPASPVYAGKLNALGYVHDGYVDNDMLYSGHIGSGFFAIVNVANKSNPIVLNTQPTPNGTTHNTWLSGTTLFTTDETSNSFLAAYNVSNPANITFLDKIQSNPGSNSIVHNTYILNDYAITSWYKDGITIVDAARPSNLVQVGNYDTYPGQGGSGFDGCWGVYPYLPSGTIIASNISAQGTEDGELFVLTPDYIRGCYLEGIVADAVTHQPIVGANVQILSTTTTDNSVFGGVYKMGQLASGTFTVQATKSGYNVFTTTVTLANGVLTQLDIPMVPLSLPVELVRFDATSQGRTALLSWQTAQEYNNAGFKIQHSTDGLNWTDAGFVAAKTAAANGNTYDFKMNDLQAGTHFFRLQQMDVDGKTTTSDARSVRISGRAFTATIQPTLTHAGTTLTCTTEHATTLQISITDETGRSTGRTWSVDVEDSIALPISTDGLSPGVYFVRVAGSQINENAVLKIVVN